MKLATVKRKAKREGWAKWIRSESDERAAMDGYTFDIESGEHICTFFERYLRHTRYPLEGKPFTLLDWQRDDVLMPLFGWKRADGLRRYSKGDIFVAKKQGKSTLAAGLAIYFLVCGGDRSEVYGVAHTRDQAAIIYREAAAMATATPEISAKLKVLKNSNRILYPARMGFYQAMAGEASARGSEGINPNLVLFDEIHVQRSRELYDSLAYASAARTNSLMLSVSTVGVADETTIWWEQYEYAKGIIAGTITDHSRFAYVAQADEGCLHSSKLRNDPKQWAKAMPSLGVTVTQEKVAEAVREAENSPSKLNSLLRYLFNIPTAQVSRVVPMDQWGRGKSAEPELIGKRCFGGLDVASRRDLTAFVLYFPKQPGLEKSHLKAWHWCPESTIRKHVLAGRQYYQKWVDDGWLIETHGDTLDHDEVKADIEQAFQDYTIEEVGVDPANADAIVNPLFNTGYPLVKIMQTHAGMSPGTTALLADIESEKVSHCGDAVLTWCFSNCAGDTRGEEVKFVKDADASKIDGAVAAAMARGRSLASAAEGNIYDTRGIVQI
jgi:phage terminase large subunit-like protein